MRRYKKGGEVSHAAGLLIIRTSKFRQQSLQEIRAVKSPSPLRVRGWVNEGMLEPAVCLLPRDFYLAAVGSQSPSPTLMLA